jgi:hypothetical protein
VQAPGEEFQVHVALAAGSGEGGVRIWYVGFSAACRAGT